MDDIRDKIAILLGQTGAGKSSFINCITKKKECKVGDTADSCTKDIHQVNSSQWLCLLFCGYTRLRRRKRR